MNTPATATPARPAFTGHRCLGGNLAMAREASAYVRKHMTLGASNNGFEWVKSQYAFIALSETGQCVLDHKNDRNAWAKRNNPTMYEYIRWNANHALLVGCGNCDEYAMAAYWYLLNRPVCPIDLMAIPGEHVFVAVGRRAGSDPSRPQTWGEEAVICDAWDDEVDVALGVYLRWILSNDFDARKKTIISAHRTD